MSNDKMTWSGNPADFGKAYEWAGKANLMEERGNEGKGYKLSAYHSIDGWVEVKPGATMVKDTIGEIRVESKADLVGAAVKKTEQAAEGSETQVPSSNETPVPDPIGPGTDKETKDSPVVGGIETKPALGGTAVGTVSGDQVSEAKPASDPADVAANSGTAASIKAAKSSE